jgi:hypothetical protein
MRREEKRREESDFMVPPHVQHCTVSIRVREENGKYWDYRPEPGADYSAKGIPWKQSKPKRTHSGREEAEQVIRAAMEDYAEEYGE